MTDSSSTLEVWRRRADRRLLRLPERLPGWPVPTPDLSRNRSTLREHQDRLRSRNQRLLSREEAERCGYSPADVAAVFDMLPAEPVAQELLPPCPTDLCAGIACYLMANPDALAAASGSSELRWEVLLPNRIERLTVSIRLDRAGQAG